jgi:hypothetical protein
MVNLPGIWSAKLIQRAAKDREPVQDGPLPQVKVPDPREELLKQSLGPSDWFRPNGRVVIRPEDIQLLGS